MTCPNRNDGRSADALRPVRLTPGFVGTADGSCLIEMGKTRVICTASCEEKLPPWRVDSGRGWVTAEYGMLPASTSPRKSRPISKPDSRSVEIQRLIGRVLRSAVDLEQLGPRQIQLDCDVLEADGGTRTAAITGAYVCLAQVIESLIQRGLCDASALLGPVAAVSVGVVAGQCLLDLDYSEDSQADVDMNVAMIRGGKFLEVQASAEAAPLEPEEFNDLLALASEGIEKLMACQLEALGQGEPT
jgi:ribonuclease PH